MRELLLVVVRHFASASTPAAVDDVVEAVRGKGTGENDDGTAAEQEVPAVVAVGWVEDDGDGSHDP